MSLGVQEFRSSGVERHEVSSVGKLRYKRKTAHVKAVRCYAPDSFKRAVVEF